MDIAESIYTPPVTASGTKIDVPKLPNQSTEKMAVMILELLQTARTQNKNNNEVAGIATTKEDAMRYRNFWQSEIDAALQRVSSNPKDIYIHTEHRPWKRVAVKQYVRVPNLNITLSNNLAQL